MSITRINVIGDRQGWDDRTKIDLLCRFIDSLEVTKDLKLDAELGRWLENQAAWENLRKGENDE